MKVSLQRVPVRVLLVSQENGAIETLRRSMEQASMIVDVCSDETTAAGKLARLECEAVVLDFRNKEGSREFLARIRATKFHRRVIALAILDADNDVEGAFRAGANFVFERPLFPRIVARTLKAAYPLMLQERRSHFRCPIEIPVKITPESMPEFQATAVNLSEGGICLLTDVSLQMGAKLQLGLTLPCMSEPTKICGEVRWDDGGKHLGIQFLQLPSAIVENLKEWLALSLQHFFASKKPGTSQQVH